MTGGGDGAYGFGFSCCALLALQPRICCLSGSRMKLWMLSCPKEEQQQQDSGLKLHRWIEMHVCLSQGKP